MTRKILFICLVFTTNIVSAQLSNVWVADNGDGTYKNPVIHADYSDPDAIRVGSDFYMISSSFNYVPGLPILKSTDLVNWSVIGYALTELEPKQHFSTVQHGGGVWAPSIRYHNSEFYIYYPDPDFGIYLVKAKSILGPWSKPVLVEAGKGLIDPCPLWDTDGRVYLVHAFAGSRAGFKSILVIKELNGAGEKVIGEPVLIYDGHEKDATVEGPKIYKKNNYYYVFAPAGGVSTGWQIVLRSKNIYGPYDRKVVMAEGSSGINGPHQGAWVSTPSGEDWFLHFQDKDAYGRVVLLEPMSWKNDWPIIGSDIDGDGIGQPVLIYKKPTGLKSQVSTVADSDEFNKPTTGLQWQWQADPKIGWGFPGSNGTYRLYAKKPQDSFPNKWMLPNLFLQKFPAPEFTVTTRLSFHPSYDGDRAGLIIFGADYAYVSLLKKNDGNYLSMKSCEGAEKGNAEKAMVEERIDATEIHLRVAVAKNATCNFSYSIDGINFKIAGESFTAAPGKWVGAKVGLFATAEITKNDAGFADVDWFRFNR